MKKLKPSELGKELRKIGELTEKTIADEIMQILCIDGFAELVNRSAQDTGFLRSLWSVTTESAPEEVFINLGGNFADAVWPGIKINFGDRVTFYNNTEYAIYLEEGTPYQKVQPMIEPTYQMLLSQARQLSRELSKKRFE